MNEPIVFCQPLWMLGENRPFSLPDAKQAFVKQCAYNLVNEDYWFVKRFYELGIGAYTVDMLLYDAHDDAPVLLYIVDSHTDLSACMYIVGAATSALDNLATVHKDTVDSVGKKCLKKVIKSRGFTGKPILHVISLANELTLFKPTNSYPEVWVDVFKRLDVTVRTSILYGFYDADNEQTRLFVLPFPVYKHQSFDGKKLEFYNNEDQSE